MVQKLLATSRTPHWCVAGLMGLTVLGCGDTPPPPAASTAPATAAQSPNAGTNTPGMGAPGGHAQVNANQPAVSGSGTAATGHEQAMNTPTTNATASTGGAGGHGQAHGSTPPNGGLVPPGGVSGPGVGGAAAAHGTTAPAGVSNPGAGGSGQAHGTTAPTGVSTPTAGGTGQAHGTAPVGSTNIPPAGATAPGGAGHGQAPAATAQPGNPAAPGAAHAQNGQAPAGGGAPNASAPNGAVPNGASVPGSGQSGAPGQQQANQFPPGSAEDSLLKFCTAMSEGNLTAAAEYVSPRSKGMLTQIREGQLPEAKIDELKEAFALQGLQNKPSRNTGVGRTINLGNAKGQTLSFNLSKEGEVYLLREFTITAVRKR